MLSFYLDDLRLDLAVVSFLADWLSFFTLALGGQLRSHSCGYLCGIDLILCSGEDEVGVLRK